MNNQQSSEETPTQETEKAQEENAPISFWASFVPRFKGKLCPRDYIRAGNISFAILFYPGVILALLIWVGCPESEWLARVFRVLIILIFCYLIFTFPYIMIVDLSHAVRRLRHAGFSNTEIFVLCFLLGPAWVFGFCLLEEKPRWWKKLFN